MRAAKCNATGSEKTNKEEESYIKREHTDVYTDQKDADKAVFILTCTFMCPSSNKKLYI